MTLREPPFPITWGNLTAALWWTARVRACEIFTGWAIKAAPKGYVPSYVEACTDAYHRRGIFARGDGERAVPARCKITGNPVGTDTWVPGHECPCEPCQRMLSAGATTT